MKSNQCSDNKYLLTMMVAKRSKQLNQGYKALLEDNLKSNRLLALKEIKEGIIYIKEGKESKQKESLNSKSSYLNN